MYSDTPSRSFTHFLMQCKFNYIHPGLFSLSLTLSHHRASQTCLLQKSPPGNPKGEESMTVSSPLDLRSTSPPTSNNPEAGTTNPSFKKKDYGGGGE